jgi:hypothetical protein
MAYFSASEMSSKGFSTTLNINVIELLTSEANLEMYSLLTFN